MRPRRAFWLVLIVLVATLVVLCACEAVVGDSWGHVLRLRRDGPLTWQRFGELARDNHLHNNPRWGQLVLVATFEHRVLQLVLTPLAIASLLLATLALVRARLPRPSDPRDASLLLLVIALALVTTPQLGAIWFYRPTCCNYVYPLAVQLAWLVPYRVLAERHCEVPTLAMVLGGVLAGAGNEHTGLALALAALVATALAYRRDRRVPLWALAGLVGVVVGYAYLLAAPAQLARYRGLAGDTTPLDRIAERGITGNLAVVAQLAAWLSPAVLLFAAAGVPALRRCPRAVWREAAIWCALACVVLATALASPKQVARLLLAPSALFAIGVGVVLVEVSQLPVVARRLRITATTIIALYGALLLLVQVVTYLEGRARMQRLLAAPPGSVVHVPALTFSRPTPFSAGDDFRSARQRARVAARLGVAAIVRD